MVGHVAGDDRAEDADGGDDRRTVTAPLLRQGFGDQRDAAAEFAGQAESGDETPEGIGLETINQPVRDIRHRIEQDGTEERREPSHAIAEDAEEDAAEEHAHHLPGKEVLIPRGAGDEVPEAEAVEALLPHGHEQRQVVDVDEVAQGADDDGGVQQVLPKGARFGREVGGAHEGGVTLSDRAGWPWKCQTTLPRSRPGNLDRCR